MNPQMNFKSQKNKTPSPARNKIGLAVLLTVVAVIAVLIYAQAKNPAKNSVSFITSELARDGGQKICELGDAGHGLDNRQPWYDASYLIPDQTSLGQTLQSLAEVHGYKLITTSDYQKQTGKDYIGYGSKLKSTLYVEDDKGSEFYVSTVNAQDLQISIFRGKKVQVDCEKYRGSNFKIDVPDGKAVVRVIISKY